MNDWEVTLVTEAKKGNSKCFEELYALYYKKVFAVIRATVKNGADAEDILQLTFLSAWRGLKSLSNPSAFNTWIQRIAINHCYELLRKKNIAILLNSEAELDSIAEDASDELIPAVYAEREDLRIRLGGILEGLSEVQRQTVTLFYFNELKVEEIADAMVCNVGTVKTRLFLARKAIRNEIEEQERKSGQKFYGIAGIPTLPLSQILVRQIGSASLSPAASSGILGNIASEIASEASVAAQTAAGTSAASVASSAGAGATAAGTVAKAGIPLTVKVIAGIAAVAVAVTIGVATRLNHRNAAGLPPAPTVSSPQPSEQPSATPAVSERPAEKDYLALYTPVLDDYRGLVRGTTIDNRFGIPFSENMTGMAFTEIDFGYALKDLDGNGTPELALLAQSIGSQALAVYTLADDAPCLLTKSMPLATANIRADGTILMAHYLEGANHVLYASYRISGNGTTLEFVEGYQSAQFDPQGVISYTYHTTDPMNPAIVQAEAVSITDEEFSARTGSLFPYTYEDVGLQFIPLFDTAPADSGTATQVGTFTPLEANVPVEADVDGDGNMDTVCVTVEYDEYEVTQSISIATNGTPVAVTPVGADPENEYSIMEMFSFAYLYRAPDGACGVLIGSWPDYQHDSTMRLFRYNGMQPVQAYEGYGNVLSASGDTLQAETTVSVFGHWYASCEYVVTPDFRIVLKEGALYTNLTPAYSESEDNSIILVREIPVGWYRNGAWEAGSLGSGEVITPFETDGEQFFYAHESHGTLFRIEFEKRDEYGDEIYVSGIHQGELFEALPYYNG